MRAHILALTLLITLAAIPALAQEEFDDDSFFQEITEGEEKGAADNGSSETVQRPEIGGELRLGTRYSYDRESLGETAVVPLPELRLTLDYAAESADLHASGQILQEELEGDPRLDLEELYLRYYARGFDFEAGYMKVVWGPGDGVHAVDVLNATDYSDFINPDYLERKLASPILKLNIPVNQGLLELAYLPVFTPDEIPQSGAWTPAEVQTLLTLPMATTITEEETEDLAHSQFAFRFARSYGLFDLGAVYYLGFYRQPTVIIEPTYIKLNYDQVNMFGLDGAAALGGVNLRGELAWFMTQDYQGDDPELRNGELRWVGGFDLDLPISELNLNLQESGTLLLDYLEIDDNGTADVQAEERLTRNILILNLSDSWGNATLTPELTVLYGIEERDWVVRPEFAAVIDDDFEIRLVGAFYAGGEEDFFGQFDGNDFIELSLAYSF